MGPTRTRGLELLRRFGPYLLLVFVVMGIAGLHISRFQQLSPIDELRHVDYLQRASHLHFPRLGDKLDQPAMREEACRGVDLSGYESPPCHSKRFDPFDFRDDGWQNATFHPPTYYLANGLISRGLVEVGLFDSIVDPARLVSAALVALGLSMTVFFGAMLGLRRGDLVAVCLLTLVHGEVLSSATSVNPDSASILAGALVMVIALLWERGALPTWALFVAGGGATAFKFTNFFAVAIVATVFLIRAIPTSWAGRLRERLRHPAIATGGTAAQFDDSHYDSDPRTLGVGARRYIAGAVAVVAGALFVVLLWSLIDSARALIDAGVIPQNRIYAYGGIPHFEWLFQPSVLYAFLPPIPGYMRGPIALDVWVASAQIGVSLLLVAGVLSSTLRFRRDDRFALLGGATLFIALIAPPMFVLGQAVINQILFGVATRYGLSMLPAFLVLAAACVRSTTGRVVLWGFSGLATLALFVALIADGPALAR